MLSVLILSKWKEFRLVFNNQLSMKLPVRLFIYRVALFNVTCTELHKKCWHERKSIDSKCEYVSRAEQKRI